MDSNIGEMLLQQRGNLIRHIKIDENLFKTMKDSALITDRQESRIKASGDPYTQIETLLDLLPRLGRDAFQKFCQVLKATGQEKIVQDFLTLPGGTIGAIGYDEGMDVTDAILGKPQTALISEALVPLEIVVLNTRLWLGKTERSKVVITEIKALPCDYVSVVTEKPGTSLTSGVSDICLPYLAPELCGDPPLHSHKADIWGVGCAVINMLSGKAPWHDCSNDPKELKAHISSHPWDVKKYIPSGTPSDMHEILDYMLAPEPERRWTASKLLDHGLLRGDRSSGLIPLGGQQLTENLSSSVDTSSRIEAGDKPMVEADSMARHPSSSSAVRSSGLKSIVTEPKLASPGPKVKNKAPGTGLSQVNVQQVFFRHLEKVQLTQTEQVVSSLIPSVISDVRRTWSEFWDLFKRLNSRQNLIFLGVNDGMTMLHQIVFHCRTSFLDVVFNLGIWPNLIDIRTEGGAPEYRTLTAMEMAQKMNKSSLWKEMDKLSREEESLNEWHKAARIGDKSEIDRLLGQNPSPYVINQPSMYGKTPLYWACTSGEYVIMDKLVRAGADIFCRAEDGDTLMTRVVSLNHAQLVRPLASEWGLDPEQHGLNRKSPLYLASENGNLETFKALLNVGTTLSGLALVSAAVSGKVQFMKTLMDEYHLHPNWKDVMGKTAFLAAAAAGQVDSMNILLERGADITIVDKRKRNVLHFAVEGGSEVALNRAIEICKSKNILKNLLNAQDVFSGAESIFLVRGKDQGRPAWHYVLVRRARLYMFREKTQGGPIDVAHYGSVVRSGWGQAPSQAASSEIERKYSPDQIPPTAPTDLSPLMLAIMKDQHPLVQILLKDKPKLEIQDCYGLTAFHLACMKGSINTVKTLVLAGCKTDVRDGEDRTPLQVAKENGHSVVANFLEGRSHIKMVKRFVHEDLARAHRALDSRSLEEVQNNQGDLKRYAVGVLRELQADINQLLFDVGSAPIGQETSDE